ncbi:hypothetical protein CAP35_11010 [Chitinophagaceae bacterium IBVUCB1]|nr:hypothetical protein CAP35_11010 [Chitinophagaceae bacterium IBVUCB1]
MPQQYAFISHWKVKAPIETVWKLIYDSEKWPDWWKGVVSVTETYKGDERGIGSIRRYKMRSPMLYTLSFDMELTERADLELLKGNASGQLDGTGAWMLTYKDGITDVQCHWHVATTRWWMNTFAFLLRPAFHYNHAAVMKNGAISVADKLQTEVVVIS